MVSSNGVRSILDLIGSTPVVKLRKIPQKDDAEVWGKLESMNPGGSVKDRICLSMVEAAERDGKLKPGGTIVEPTSGNTGIGLALVSAVKGYRLILTMPDTMSEERRSLLTAYGAKLILTPDTKGMGGAIQNAKFKKSKLTATARATARAMQPQIHADERGFSHISTFVVRLTTRDSRLWTPLLAADPPDAAISFLSLQRSVENISTTDSRG